MTVAQDKKSPPAHVFAGTGSGMTPAGRGSTNFSNFVESITYPFNDGVCPQHQAGTIYTRETPYGDTNWGGLPAGYVCHQAIVVSSVVTGFKHWFKYGTGANSWAEIASANSLMVAETSYTSAEIKALKATPKVLVAAPGADLAIVPVAINIVINYGGTNVFTETDDDLSVCYATTPTEIKEIEGTDFIDQAVDEWRYITFEHAETFIPLENQAVVMTNLDDEFAGNAGADNTMATKLWYRIVPTDI